jgi:hypothetical protein
MMQVLASGNIQAVQFSIEMEMVLTRSELFHMEHGAMAGPIPMDLVHTSPSKHTSAALIKRLRQREGQLERDLPSGSAALRSFDSQEFQLVALDVCMYQVCRCPSSNRLQIAMTLWRCLCWFAMRATGTGKGFAPAKGCAS